MAYGLGREKRKTKEEEEAGSANCFSRLPNFASPIVWIIAHRFEFASQVGIPTPPDSFLPFWLLLICICFLFCFTVFLLFYSINNCVVSSWKNSHCLPGFPLVKSFSGYLSAHVLFSLSALSDSWRGSQQLCYAMLMFCFSLFLFLLVSCSVLCSIFFEFARLWLSSFDYRRSLKSIWPPFLFHFTTMFFSLKLLSSPTEPKREISL